MDVLKLNLINKDREQKVSHILSSLTISDDNTKLLKEVFEKELDAGLRSGLKESSLQMENTYVPELTNGKEKGSYLALDLGGTNFRVMFLELANGKIVNEKVAYYSLPEATRLGPGPELFDFLAECILDFVQANKLNDCTYQAIPLGFTFSFPMTQRGLGKLKGK